MGRTKTRKRKAPKKSDMAPPPSRKVKVEAEPEPEPEPEVEAKTVEAELPPPTLTRTDTMTPFEDEAHLELFNKLQSMEGPAKPKRKRRKKVKLQPSKIVGGAPRRGDKPEWLANTATLRELIPVLSVSAGEVVFDISEQPHPYNKYTAKILRQFTKKSREYPQLCSGWNIISCKKGDEIIRIPLNGRHATRGTGDSIQRGKQAFITFKKLGIEAKPSISMLKDLGYGAARAVQLLKLWEEVEMNPSEDPVHSEDQGVQKALEEGEVKEEAKTESVEEGKEEEREEKDAEMIQT